MDYNNAQIQAAFEASGKLAKGATCRLYSSEQVELVYFNMPSKLIDIAYDCTEKHFVIEFKKFHSSWGDYTTAITRGVHGIMRALNAGGLDVPVPPEPEDLEIVLRSGPDGKTFVRWRKNTD